MAKGSHTPPHMVYKTCQRCTRGVRMWPSEDIGENVFWCGQCFIINNATNSASEGSLQTVASTLYTTANNSPHLSLRWTQPLCVSSSIQQSLNLL
jgi:hypothetical protein